MQRHFVKGDHINYY